MTKPNKILKFLSNTGKGLTGSRVRDLAKVRDGLAKARDLNIKGISPRSSVHTNRLLKVETARRNNTRLATAAGIGGVTFATAGALHLKHTNQQNKLLKKIDSMYDSDYNSN